MKILFHPRIINFRGVTNSTVDYAHYNQEILGNESTLIYRANWNPEGIDTGSKQEVIDLLSKRFEILTYESDEDLNKIAEKYDLFYTQKAGHFDEEMVLTTKTAIHCVFQYYQPHGDVYAYISEWLAKTMSNLSETDLPFVPYVVDLPPIEPMMRKYARYEYGIPEDAFVIGRHGGFQTFDLEFVNNALPRLCEKHPKLYFLLANTNERVKHPRIIYVSPFFDQNVKTSFISACDAAVHGRRLGESFGLGICENLFHNIPVIAWEGGFDQNHVELLEPYNLLYSEYGFEKKVEEIMNKVSSNPEWCLTLNQSVSQFTPKKVMEKFKNVFLDN